jgi:hypothetical protein
MKTALRWGFVLALGLALLAGLGWRVQLAKQTYRRLYQENLRLREEARRLEAALARAKSPERVLEWSRSHGFVPLPEGRWRR